MSGTRRMDAAARKRSRWRGNGAVGQGLVVAQRMGALGLAARARAGLVPGRDAAGRCGHPMSRSRGATTASDVGMTRLPAERDSTTWRLVHNATGNTATSSVERGPARRLGARR
jgi:hypothetical protein